jgi:16S rRNA G966 N2-methylase RsmD
MTRYVKDKVTFDKTLNGVIYRKYRTFRIITSENNQMVTTDKQPIQKLESKISEITELTPDRSYPDIEFWILSRSEGFGFFGARVTRHPDFTKSLPKGELRPELAHILSLISEPQITDTFLDPFAGYGSIPDARTSYPYEKIIASDNDENLIKKLRLRFENRKNIEIMNLDALKLKELDDQTIDKIVTDPPWGHFLGKELNLEEFYTAMLDSFYRVLKKGGKAVILIGEKELFEKLLKQKEKLFKLIEKFTTLVSGHKAGVYKIQSPKNPQDKEG